MTLFRHARLVLPDRVLDDGWLRTEGDRIAALGAPDEAPGTVAGESEVDLAGAYLLAGFVDMHVHGGGGVAYSSGDADEARRAFAFHLGHGTTTAIASTVTGRIEDLERHVATLAGLVDEGLLAGIHLEGPFISKARCGAHDPELLGPPAPEPLRRLIDAGHGTVRMVTIAAELDHALTAIDTLTAAGVIAAVGHTDATYEQTRVAYEHGARVATHLFNGMPELRHREPGPVGASLEREDVIVELVNDGMHVHPAVVGVVFDAVGVDRVALITDAMSATGVGDGLYPLGPLTVRVENGVAKLVDRDTIAGSTLTMDAALRRAVREVGVPLHAASRAASLTPARALGLDDELGSLVAGKRADLVVLDDDLAVTAVYARGVRHEDAAATPSSAGV
jgi:N-acetylglucosamine-6-phosphate deacetylase